MQKPIDKLYRDYWQDPAFRNEFLIERVPLYERMAKIAARLGVHKILDVGCACGQFVDLCVAAGMDAWGLDLPIEEVRAGHGRLPCGGERFVYGAVEDTELQQKLASLGPWDLVTCVATLRHLADVAPLVRLDARYYLIGEASDNTRVRRLREHMNDIRLWSPGDLADRFTGYAVQRVYLPRFLMKIERPPRWILGLVNMMAKSYGVLLRRVEGSA